MAQGFDVQEFVFEYAVIHYGQRILQYRSTPMSYEDAEKLLRKRWDESRWGNAVAYPEYTIVPVLPLIESFQHSDIPNQKT